MKVTLNWYLGPLIKWSHQHPITNLSTKEDDCLSNCSPFINLKQLSMKDHLELYPWIYRAHVLTTRNLHIKCGNRENHFLKRWSLWYWLLTCWFQDQKTFIHLAIKKNEVDGRWTLSLVVYIIFKITAFRPMSFRPLNRKSTDDTQSTHQITLDWAKTKFQLKTIVTLSFDLLTPKWNVVVYLT